MSIRTTQPSNTNKYYLTPAGGGYNQCILGNTKNKYGKRPTTYSVLPNCVGYCYGRYLEFWGLTKAPLPTVNAKEWYAVAKANGFKCSTTPSVGSVACFRGTTYGHVAFVEEIKSNGDLMLSESNWSHQLFRNVTVTKSSGYRYSTSLKLVGFIANPNPPKVTKPAEKAPAKTTPAKTTTVKKYTTGEYRVNTNVLNVRKGPGTKYALKTFGQFSKDAQRQIKKLAGEPINGYVKGMRCTVLEVDGNFGRTPSGWICLDFCKKI